MISGLLSLGYQFVASQKGILFLKAQKILKIAQIHQNMLVPKSLLQSFTLILH